MKINNHILPDKVNVLGTDYKIVYDTEEDNPTMKGNDGSCDSSVHEIHICKTLFLPTEDASCMKDLPSYGRKVIRHEIVHAFFEESGLAECCSWARDETLTDWIARQFPKLFECFDKAGVNK